MKEVEGFVERTEQGCFLFFFQAAGEGRGVLWDGECVGGVDTWVSGHWQLPPWIRLPS